MVLFSRQFIEVATEPHVVLITGERATKFATDIVNVFSIVTHRGGVDTIVLSEHKQRYELDTEIVHSLSKASKAVVLDDFTLSRSMKTVVYCSSNLYSIRMLTGIDKLRGDAPLSLHSACDHDHSPYPSALILLTINRAMIASNKHCETEVLRGIYMLVLYFSFLADEWHSEYMNKDRISPILSRITSYVICLRE
ncbi:unnamed protein product [Toxocara canis]|uniref:MurR/RpiR family transcriptional regulator n=1 Tax=Toxocara canis TaxID=6265 RepID=A0A183UVB2_TOXCA|nr:unnamed protein product [Toxocara canis]